MSYRQGHNVSRHNPAFVHSDNNPPPASAAVSSGTPSQPGAPAAAPPIYYHHHRGHKRGHSYGGPVSPAAAAFHHARLEARPSHPNTHQGALPTHPTPITNSSALMKGHRRALSGCMPMMGGIGVVAWSSLRELQSPDLHSAIQGLRSRSPIEIPGTLRPGSPEERASVKDGTLNPGRPLSPDDSDGKKEDLSGMECGLGPCNLPVYFHELANIKVFVGILSLLVTLQQAVASGYVSSVITTIEARFEIPSKYTGLVASAYEIGNVVTVLFVSYLGAKRHIPRWIAVGVLVMVVGCIVFTLPHFISTDPNASGYPGSLTNSYVTQRLTQGEEDAHGSQQSSHFNNSYSTSGHNASSLYSTYNVTTSQLQALHSQAIDSSSGNNAVCHSRNPPQPLQYIDNTRRNGHLEEDPFQDKDGDGRGGPAVRKVDVSHVSTTYGCSYERIGEDGQVETVEPEGYAHPLILFIIAQLLLGCGGSPLFTLGITFIDDHVSKESSSVYIGFIYAMGAFGPVLGFLMGGWLLLIPSSSGFSNPDNFVGMWWGGFIIVGACLFVGCLPFLTFPKFLRQTSSKEAQFEIEETPAESSETPEEEDGQYGQSIRDIPRSMWRLITNPAYVITCLGGCMEMNIISGFVVFLPKYLETQFGMGKSKAASFTGGIAIPGAFLGILAGGYIMKRLQLTPSGAAKLVVITNCVCLVGHAFFFFLGCNNPKLAGATVPYPDSLLPMDYTPLEVNLTSACNVDCSCDSSLDAQYVCHNGITYFSPCHAGCSANLTQCACAMGADVIPGVCPDSPCTTLTPFMVVLFFMTATVAMTQMPLLMIVLRSVSAEERSFALGMQFVLFRLLGYIPSPIVFGNVIDSACLLWSIRRCSSVLPAVSGRCLRYDIMDFRYKYLGMLTGFKLMAMVLFMIDFFQLRRMEKAEEKAELVAAENEAQKIQSNSVYSLDKLFDDGTDTENGENELKAMVTVPMEKEAGVST